MKPREWRRACLPEGKAVELFRLAVVGMLIAIVYNLGAALFSLSRGNRDPERDGKRMVRSLTWRIGLSVALFLMILVAWKYGIIQPHGVGA